MEASANVVGHPIHPMLIAFSFGLVRASLFFDRIALATHRPDLLQASFYMTAGSRTEPERTV